LGRSSDDAAVLGEHGDLDIRTKLAYLVRVNGHSLLFAADSCNISPEMYRHVHKEIGDVDVVFLGWNARGANVVVVWAASDGKNGEGERPFAAAGGIEL